MGNKRHGILARYRYQAKRPGPYGDMGRKLYAYLQAIMLDPCVYCGHFGCDSLDHVIPKGKGGHNGWANFAPCHKDCNIEKGSRGLLEWLSSYQKASRPKSIGRPLNTRRRAT